MRKKAYVVTSYILYVRDRFKCRYSFVSQTAQQVIQLSDELRAELANGGNAQSADQISQVEMKLLQLRQVRFKQY